MKCDPCLVRDLETEAVEQIPGFNADGAWIWNLPVCAVHAGRGLVACESCYDKGVMRPGEKHGASILCDNCASEQGELQSQRRLEA